MLWYVSYLAFSVDEIFISLADPSNGTPFRLPFLRSIFTWMIENDFSSLNSAGLPFRVIFAEEASKRYLVLLGIPETRIIFSVSETESNRYIPDSTARLKKHVPRKSKSVKMSLDLFIS